MTIEEFRDALRALLNEAARAGLKIDAILEAADKELHPAFDLDAVMQ